MTTVTSRASATTGTGQGADRTQLRVPARPDEQDTEVAGVLLAVARVTLEVLAGLRSAKHLAPFLAPGLRHRLHRKRGTVPWECLPGIDAVGPAEATWPARGVCEATVLFRCGARTAALALRLERVDDGWQLVEVDCPRTGTGS